MGIAIRINGQAPPDVPLLDIDLGSLDFWRLADDVRDGAFATLRREAPIVFFPQLTKIGEEHGRGHWALMTYDDVGFASRHPEAFSSVPSVVMADLAAAVSEYYGSMLTADGPRHHRLRSIVSRAFTPNMLERTGRSVRDWARRLVAAMVDNHPDGVGELVAEVAGPLPLQVICDMMGIPDSDHEHVLHLTRIIMGFGDPDIALTYDAFVKATVDLGVYGQTLAEDRRRSPRNDLTSSLVQADVDGERLTSGEIASFFNLLAAAGIETTRSAITHGVLALTHYPEQRQTWWNDFDGVQNGGRRDRALGIAGDLHAPHRYPRHRTVRHPDGRRRQSHHVACVGQP